MERSSYVISVAYLLPHACDGHLDSCQVQVICPCLSRDAVDGFTLVVPEGHADAIGGPLLFRTLVRSTTSPLIAVIGSDIFPFRADHPLPLGVRLLDHITLARNSVLFRMHSIV